MKHILLVSISPDPPGSHRVVQVPDDDPAIIFCHKWEHVNESAWVDHAEDSRRLRAMWNRLKKLADSQRLNVPCHIDHVIYGWSE